MNGEITHNASTKEEGSELTSNIAEGELDACLSGVRTTYCHDRGTIASLPREQDGKLGAGAFKRKRTEEVVSVRGGEGGGQVDGEIDMAAILEVIEGELGMERRGHRPRRGKMLGTHALSGTWGKSP